LVNILREFSQDFYKTEFMQKVLMDSLACREQWLLWARELESLPSSLVHIIDVLSNVIDNEDLNQFKEVLIDVALCVAMAFKECDQKETEASSQISVRQLIAKWMGDKKSGRSLEHANISSQEKEALQIIMVSMGYKGL